MMALLYTTHSKAHWLTLIMIKEKRLYHKVLSKESRLKRPELPEGSQ